VSQFTKNKELDNVLSSGVSTTEYRAYSTAFDQRRSLNASGVVVVDSNARTYAADGAYGISDYYPLTINATGLLQVNIRDQNSCGDVIILDSSGNEVMTASPSKLSSRANSTTTQRIGSSGTYYTYIQLRGRSGAEYRIGIDVIQA